MAEADTANVEAPGSADNSSAASSNSAVTESSVKNNPLFNLPFNKTAGVGNEAVCDNF